MADCRFIAFHGWGFNDQYWKPWANYLSEYGYFETYDRGYFNEPKEVEILTVPVSTVLITHSYGLHWIDESLFSQADLLIVTSGFLYFHPYAAQYRRRSRLVLQEMVNEFEVHPEQVLKEFYENCYAPESPPQIDISDINHQLLLEDLQDLQDAEQNVHLLRKADKICIIHGSDDHIVPYKKGRQLYTQLQAQAQYFEIKNAGHALPYTHYKQCLEFVTPEIEKLAEIKL